MMKIITEFFRKLFHHDFDGQDGFGYQPIKSQDRDPPLTEGTRLSNVKVYDNRNRIKKPPPAPNTLREK